jgi:circadian clock protein KaiB
MTQHPIIELRLYKAGNGPNSIRAVANALALCNEHNTLQHCELEIIDVLEAPWRALQDGVLVTPTLLRIFPNPKVRIIGDLSERAHVLVALNMG